MLDSNQTIPSQSLSEIAIGEQRSCVGLIWLEKTKGTERKVTLYNLNSLSARNKDSLIALHINDDVDPSYPMIRSRGKGFTQVTYYSKSKGCEIACRCDTNHRIHFKPKSEL